MYDNAARTTPRSTYIGHIGRTEDDCPSRAQFFMERSHPKAQSFGGQTPASESRKITGDCRYYVPPKSPCGFCRDCGSETTAKQTFCNECMVAKERKRQEKWHHRALQLAIAANEPLRPCKVCGGPIPLEENGRKVRTDTMTCGPECRRTEYNRRRSERKARRQAEAA